MHEKSSAPDPHRIAAEAALATIPFREPVVADYIPEIHARMPGEDLDVLSSRVRTHDVAVKQASARVDQKWLQLTEVVRRDLPTNPQLRIELAKFTSQPLSEKLPETFTREVKAHDPRAERFMKRASGKLGDILGLPAVPDDVLPLDISNAPALARSDQYLATYTSLHEQQPEAFERRVSELRERVTANPGRTTTERDLIGARYKYARDVKLLGLGAELYDNPAAYLDAKDGMVTYDLPSGTSLAMTTEVFEKNPDLLNPAAWEGRKQLKDRVYEVTIGGQNYILKERKTPRHTDTKENGHVDGNTSAEEFAAARDFAEQGDITLGDVEVTWEKPLGHVEFPDGYQFTLFDKESELDMYAPIYAMQQAIEDRPEKYAEEYEAVRAAAKKLYDEDRFDLMRFSSRRKEDEIKKPKRVALTGRAREHNRNIKEQLPLDDLTFVEFAQLKAHELVDVGKLGLSDAIHARGYQNSDLDGFGFAADIGERVKLKIIGFDFEYYQKRVDLPGGTEMDPDDREKMHIGFRYSSYISSGDRFVKHPAALAMIERRGIDLPPKRGQ